MSSCPEKLEVSCPRCGETYADWYQSRDPAATTDCPHCGYALARDQLLRRDGAWQPDADDVEVRER